MVVRQVKLKAPIPTCTSSEYSLSNGKISDLTRFAIKNWLRLSENNVEILKRQELLDQLNNKG